MSERSITYDIIRLAAHVAALKPHLHRLTTLDRAEAAEAERVALRERLPRFAFAADDRERRDEAARARDYLEFREADT